MGCSVVVRGRKKEEKGKGRVVEEEEPEGLWDLLVRLTEAVEGIGYAMEARMRREVEREKKEEEEKVKKGKGKREQGVQKDKEETEDEDEEEGVEGGDGME